MIAEFSTCAPAITKFNGVAELTIFVPPDVEITEPAPNASSPSASVPETVIDPPLIVATPPLCARTPSLCTPEATIVSLVSVAVAPAPATHASTDWMPAASTLPRVVIVVPVTEIDETGRSAATPYEPSPLVITLPPLRTTLPPAAPTTPGASRPLVTIEAPPVVIVDPAPEEKTPSELAPVVVTLGASGAVIAPPALA